MKNFTTGRLLPAIVINTSLYYTKMLVKKKMLGLFSSSVNFLTLRSNERDCIIFTADYPNLYSEDSPSSISARPIKISFIRHNDCQSQHE
jgi:hypothetical protein